MTCTRTLQTKTGSNVTYETHRKVFNQENIGFSQPSQDECEHCLMFKVHDSGKKNDHPTGECDICQKYFTQQISYRAGKQETSIKIYHLKQLIFHLQPICRKLC